MPYQELRCESSAGILARFEAARSLQQARGFDNSRMPSRMLRNLCELDAAGERTLELAVRRMSLPPRVHDLLLQVARAIADLDTSDANSPKHIEEAVQYRGPDRNYWN